MSTDSTPTKSQAERYFDTLRSMDPDDELLKRIEALERAVPGRRADNGPSPAGA